MICDVHKTQICFKNDEKTTLKLYMISQQIYLKKMSYVPEFVALYEIFPYIEYLPLNNETIRVSVKDYIEGGELKDVIIKKYGNIEDWNTSEVTDMNRLFQFRYYFNEDISKWDVSKVTNMYHMFGKANKFNQPIGKWDVSNVIYMTGMFSWTKSFNQYIGEWDTSKVTDMSGMFHYAKNFNQDISGWDVSNVIYMKYMFWHAENFNQYIGEWDTSNVITKFNRETVPWYTSKF